MRILASLLAVLTLSIAAAARAPQAPPTVEPGFTSLFNGKDFTGWRIVNPDSFSIKDGAIVANGTPGHAFYDGPVGVSTFRNFELRVDVMTMPNSNGGIFVMTEYQESQWPSRGFEVQVNNTYERDRIKTGSLYQVVNVNDESPAKDHEWFTETIIVTGETVTVKVNDKEVVTWTQPADWKQQNKRIRPGTIALQAHDPGSTVHYRNIRIRELP